MKSLEELVGEGRGGVRCIESVVWDCMVNERQRLFPKNLQFRGRTDHQQFISMTGYLIPDTVEEDTADCD